MTQEQIDTFRPQVRDLSITYGNASIDEIGDRCSIILSSEELEIEDVGDFIEESFPGNVVTGDVFIVHPEAVIIRSANTEFVQKALDFVKPL